MTKKIHAAIAALAILLVPALVWAPTVNISNFDGDQFADVDEQGRFSVKLTTPIAIELPPGVSIPVSVVTEPTVSVKGVVAVNVQNPTVTFPSPQPVFQVGEPTVTFKGVPSVNIKFPTVTFPAPQPVFQVGEPTVTFKGVPSVNVKFPTVTFPTPQLTIIDSVNTSSFNVFLIGSDIALPVDIQMIAATVPVTIVNEPTVTFKGVPSINVKFPSTTIVGIPDFNIKFPSTTIVGEVPVNVTNPTSTVINEVAVNVTNPTSTIINEVAVNVTNPTSTVINEVAVNVTNPTTTIVNSELTTRVIESSNTWVYVSSNVTIQNNSVNLGAGLKGKSFTVQALGGDIEYTINGGASVPLKNGATDSEEFLPFLIINPTIQFTSLPAGVTGYVRITGGQQ